MNAHADLDLDLAREYAKKVLKLGPEQVGQGNYDNCKRIADELADRVYRIIWTLDPEDGVAKDGNVEVPLPTLKLPYQMGSYEVVGGKEHREIKRDGNNLLVVTRNEHKPFC